MQEYEKVQINDLDRLDRFMKCFSQNHSVDFKAVALKLVAANQPVEQKASLLGIGISRLYEWISEWKKRGWIDEPSGAGLWIETWLD